MSTKNTVDNLIQGILNHGPSILENCIYENHEDVKKYLERISKEHLSYPIPKEIIDKSNWFLPNYYKSLDIEAWVLDQCNTKIEQDRVKLELDLFSKHNMIPVLRTMKYIVDTLRANNIVWGVGRGSSVASYVLHIIGVHKINSIKYDIPIEEFFKGEQNG